MVFGEYIVCAYIYTAAVLVSGEGPSLADPNIEIVLVPVSTLRP